MRSSYAALVENGLVKNVIVIPNLENDDAVISEYCTTLGLDGIWIAASDGTFRFNYPGIGFTFDPAVGEHGAFIAPQPFPSWTLDDKMQWHPPVPHPTDGHSYVWNENAQEWQAVTQ